MNSDPHNNVLKFPMSHLTVSSSNTKLYIKFSSGNTVDLKMRKIGCRCIPSRDLSNSHFPLSFSCASEFIVSYETSSCRSTDPIPYLYQYVLVYKLIEGYVLAKVGPDKIYFVNRFSNFWSSIFHRF